MLLEGEMTMVNTLYIAMKLPAPGKPILSLAILLPFLMFCLITHAQAPYKWRDSNGRIIYSDTPPPPEIPTSNILKGNFKTPPKTGTEAPAQSSEQSAGANTNQNKGEEKKSGPKSLAEKELEFKKRQLEKAEAEKKAQQAAQEESERQQFCERAKGYLRSLESGVRISQTATNGELKYMDDAQRTSEIALTKKRLSENQCD